MTARRSMSLRSDRDSDVLGFHYSGDYIVYNSLTDRRHSTHLHLRRPDNPGAQMLSTESRYSERVPGNSPVNTKDLTSIDMGSCSNVVVQYDLCAISWVK